MKMQIIWEAVNLVLSQFNTSTSYSQVCNTKRTHLYKTSHLAWHKKSTHQNLISQMILTHFPFITSELLPRMPK